jgi:hypothetical protein
MEHLEALVARDGMPARAPADSAAYEVLIHPDGTCLDRRIM